MADTSLIVWRFADGKPGHDRQSAGLIRALEAIHPAESFDLAPFSRPALARAWLSRSLPAVAQLPGPHLILCAGRRTHASALTARHLRGGYCVALMRPGLPRRWFDLCIVPRHDGIPEDAHTLASCGPLNPIIPGAARGADRLLVLVGGPSKHHRWHHTRLLADVTELLKVYQGSAVTLADSRRTPVQTSNALRALAGGRIDFVSHAATGRDWVDQQLAAVAAVWVTRDSLSMLYEALSAGVAVGVLDVPRRRTSRVTRAVDQLIAEQQVTPFDAWRRGDAVLAARPALQEAQRCAGVLWQRWFANGVRMTGR